VCSATLVKATGRNDVVHIHYLGVGRDAVASTLVWMFQTNVFIGTVPVKMQSAFDEFKTYCAGINERPTIETFSRILRQTPRNNTHHISKLRAIAFAVTASLAPF
jgi:hypothetical protein